MLYDIRISRDRKEKRKGKKKKKKTEIKIRLMHREGETRLFDL